MRKIRNTGAENFGGMAVTKGGVIFIGATEDSKFRAFDKASGEVLWEFEMDAPGFASPSTYEVNGKQYVAMVAGGGGARYRSPVTGPKGKRVHVFCASRFCDCRESGEFYWQLSRYLSFNSMR